jgi:hypothetical protein
MPNSGVSQSDIKMLDIINKGMDLSSVDSAQQGVQGQGVTAREVVIANENARKLKGIFFLFRTNFWLQKTKLRLLNVLTYYTTGKVSAIVGADKAKQFRKFIINGTELSDGKKGSKGIIIAKDKKSLPTQEEIDQNVEEYKAINPGENYEEIAVTSDYINDWEYKVKVVSEDMYQKDGSYSISRNEDKLKVMATLFPEQFKLNTKKLFKDTLQAYDEDVEDYDLEQQKAPQLPADAIEGGAPPKGGQPPVPGQEVPPAEPINMAGAPSTMQ